MTDPLNGPLEVGLRVLAILDAAYPDGMDVDRLSLLDHISLHTRDFGGPESILPALPQRQSEISVGRARIEEGLQVMLRAQLIDMTQSSEGLQYVASDSSSHFISLLESRYFDRLRESAQWAVERYRNISNVEVSRITSSLATQRGQRGAGG
ncbi:ABC-three component system middle component 2 [Geodermatophilus amargosae]|uniref:ABC-three component system middle component 2 n=1 Tax=Geodermatophilus amargosae TaxID=1296565 RepID=UPI001114D5BC|nr:ABC-three component system middle component 2 [Geodermatophilus amargosae]